MGIVSCLGNTLDDVSSSLKECKSGITVNDKYKEIGMKSHVCGRPDIAPEEFIDRKQIPFMGNNCKYAYIAMERAIEAYSKASECQVQHIEGVDAASEHTCFWSEGASSAATGESVGWDVVHFNEGLHSLWPRVNTSAQQAAWADQRANFTSVLAATGATLVYATMTPYMPEKYLNPPGPPRDDVETKNELAVRAVRAAGVTRINDLYSVVTARGGEVYQNCSICDDESQYHAPYTGQCGYHYVEAGWALLANATAAALREALAARRRPQPRDAGPIAT